MTHTDIKGVAAKRAGTDNALWYERSVGVSIV